MNNPPYWFEILEREEYEFIRKFILASGSLKEMSRKYEVSYPTMRNRLDKLIEKIESCGENKEAEYISLIKKLAMEDKLDFDAAKLLIEEYRKFEL